MTNIQTPMSPEVISFLNNISKDLGYFCPACGKPFSAEDSANKIPNCRQCAQAIDWN